MITYSKFKDFTVKYNTDLNCFSVETNETLTHGFGCGRDSIQWGLDNYA